VVVRRKNDEISVSPEPLLEMPDELKKLFEEKK
jgi:hypothetical protein